MSKEQEKMAEYISRFPSSDLDRIIAALYAERELLKDTSEWYAANQHLKFENAGLREWIEFAITLCKPALADYGMIDKANQLLHPSMNL